MFYSFTQPWWQFEEENVKALRLQLSKANSKPDPILVPYKDRTLRADKQKLTKNSMRRAS